LFHLYLTFILVICGVHWTAIYALVHTSRWLFELKCEINRVIFIYVFHTTLDPMLGTESAQLSHVIRLLLCPTGGQGRRVPRPGQGESRPGGTRKDRLLTPCQLITCLLVSYPLGSIFIWIPPTRPTLKHLFSISVASFYFVPVLNQGLPFLNLLGDVLVTYFVALTVQGPRMPWIVFG
jgi:hypothetical protein